MMNKLPTTILARVLHTNDISYFSRVDPFVARILKILEKCEINIEDKDPIEATIKTEQAMIECAYKLLSKFFKTYLVNDLIIIQRPNSPNDLVAIFLHIPDVPDPDIVFYPLYIYIPPHIPQSFYPIILRRVILRIDFELVGEEQDVSLL